MLVLSRKIGEKILIGSDVSISILSQKMNQYRIGIEAPRHIPILREELKSIDADKTTERKILASELCSYWDGGDVSELIEVLKEELQS